MNNQVESAFNNAELTSAILEIWTKAIKFDFPIKPRRIKYPKKGIFTSKNFTIRIDFRSWEFCSINNPGCIVSLSEIIFKKDDILKIQAYLLLQLEPSTLPG